MFEMMMYTLEPTISLFMGFHGLPCPNLVFDKLARIGAILLPITRWRNTFRNLLRFETRGVHSLLYFAYTYVRDLFIGGFIYLAKKIIRWWYFTCKKPENIICDGILHVNMFHYFKIPYFTCTFLQNLPTMNILDPILLSHVVLRFSPVISPS